jgi:hypothetical protein
MTFDDPVLRIDRLRSEVAMMDGSDENAFELTEAEWGKVEANSGVGYGSRVIIHGQGDFNGLVDYGYLTRLPDTEDDWDMVGIVHLTHIDECDGCESAWHSLYSLCRMPWVKRIIIR